MSKTAGRTYVEMEARKVTQIALLTIYDICEAVDCGMCIQDAHLLEKQGGKSGHWKWKTVNFSLAWKVEQNSSGLP